DRAARGRLRRRARAARPARPDRRSPRARRPRRVPALAPLELHHGPRSRGRWRLDHVVELSLSSWQGTRARDPRRLTLGSAQWGMPYGIANRTGPPSRDELAELLRVARDAGIRAIDTARAYGES